MAANPDKIASQLTELAEHFNRRRPAIVEAWSAAVRRDRSLATSSTLSRTQLHDRIPDILARFESRLRVERISPHAEIGAEAKDDAGAHGRHRWQQGYHLREVVREWGHLELCLLDELERWAASRADAAPEVRRRAVRALVELSTEGIGESAGEYLEMLRAEAESQVRGFERALGEMHDLERERAELWREAAHDLRGGVGIVANAAWALSRHELPSGKRETFVRMLQTTVNSLQALLEDVTGLARLQAGHEVREVRTFDAAEVLGQLVEELRPQAVDRGLFLHAGGPRALPVEGDPVKMRRIAQNLLINAIKYTHRGGVTAIWGNSRANDPERWMLTISDTGPGVPGETAAPLAEALESATEETRASEGEDPGVHRPSSPPASSLGGDPGEGVGLAIVKRLCDLLDATLEMESAPEEGTTFRVVLPRRYPPST